MDQLNIFAMTGSNDTFSDICAKLGCENNAPAWPDDFGRAITNYMKDNNIPLVGAVHDFTCPQTGKNYMYFPIRKLQGIKAVNGDQIILPLWGNNNPSVRSLISFVQAVM